MRSVGEVLIVTGFVGAAISLIGLITSGVPPFFAWVASLNLAGWVLPLVALVICLAVLGVGVKLVGRD